MDVRACLILLSTYLFLLSCYGARGGKLTTNEDLQIIKQNKIVVKTIKTIHGDTYDCVDFYKQPAFQHPLLRNHSFHYQMKPSSNIKRMRMKGPFTNYRLSDTWLNGMWLNGKGCPHNTVPIKKITKKEIVEAKRISKPSIATHGLTINEPGVHYAVLWTKWDTKKKFNGGGMETTVHNPTVTAPQYSGVQMKVLGGSDHIQVGWMVNPSLYKDNRTRSFIYTHEILESILFLTSGNSLSTYSRGKTAYTYPRVDDDDDLISERDDPKSIQYYIVKDSGGNWWLLAGPDSTELGFWPKLIFTRLANYANYIKWGGKVYSPTNIPSPRMGNGAIKELDTGYDSNCYNIETINEDHQYVRAEDLEGYRDVRHGYEVFDMGNKKHFGHYFFYGGEGTIIM